MYYSKDKEKMNLESKVLMLNRKVQNIDLEESYEIFLAVINVDLEKLSEVFLD